MSGALHADQAFRFSQFVHILCDKKGYSDVTLDFTNAVPVRETFMVPAISTIMKYQCSGIEFQILLPQNDAGKSIFHNANWAHLISPAEHASSTYDRGQHLPASTYSDANSQSVAADQIMSLVIKAVEIDRSRLKALEWAVYEITDNVLNHAQSPIGGVVQATSFETEGKRFIEFVVADGGIGVSTSLNIKEDIKALEQAIQEGVTRNTQTNQGNGLYGTFRVCTLSGGRFEIHSQRGTLVAEGMDKIRTKKWSGPLYPGTFVVCRVGCDNEQLIEEALTFGGREHEPAFDYLEKRFEDPISDIFNFDMKTESKSFGSREYGISVRTQIQNLLNADHSQPIVINFDGIEIISSSFADEVFGRLFVSAGPMSFLSRLHFKNTNRSIRAVIDRAIMQRAAAAD